MKLLIAVAIVVLWSPVTAQGQLQLFALNGTTETPISSIYDARPVAVGDATEIRLRIRNSGATALTLQTMGLAGTGFTITSRPTLPYVLAPSSAADVRVGFLAPIAGSYSANFSVNSLSVFLRIAAAYGVEVAQEVNGVRVMVPGGATIDVGKQQRGLKLSQTLYLYNPGSVPLRVNALAAIGEAFAASWQPVTLPPGEWTSFSIDFTPSRSGDFTGALTVDQRNFALHGFSYDPTLPRPAVTLDASRIRSGEQHTVSLRFPEPAPVSGVGTLQMLFDSMVAGVATDPAAQFVKTSSRIASFTIGEGDTFAKFGGSTGLVFQTGTTAGTIRFQISMSGQPAADDLVVMLEPSAVNVDTATAIRRVSDLDVTISGFDNTYTAGTVTFIFFDSAGRTIAPGAIKADFTPDFKHYFSASTVGGAFQMRATFPVSGDASQVSGVEAEFANSAGNSKTQRIVFP